MIMISEDLMSVVTVYTQYVHCDVAGTPDLATKVVSPLLTADAKDLLLNCLTSKEADLWTSLGDAWTISRDQWKGYVPPYTPRFSDGWKPDAEWFSSMQQEPTIGVGGGGGGGGTVERPSASYRRVSQSVHLLYIHPVSAGMSVSTCTYVR